ncbi:VOC family protein [Peribacillus butanolivorans]|uniref:VOC family protein n=1 Tax=Peribacillus butanolivorans TaxID=421767 RepID=UPI003D2A7286
MSNIKGIAHIAIQAKDFDEVIRFYTNALNFKIAHTWALPEFNLEKAAMLVSSDGNTFIEVFDYEAQIAAQGRKALEHEEIKHGALLHFALTVENASEAYKTAIHFGAKNCVPPATMELGYPVIKVNNALVYSPNGEVIEFIEKVNFQQIN